MIEKTAEKKKDAGFSLDSDSDDDEEVVGLELDTNFIDEKTSAVHALGNLCLNCSGVIQPYMQEILKTLDDVSMYFHENVRYHVCLTYAQIAFGLLRLHTGKADSDDKHEWTPGIPAAAPLPAPVTEFLSTVLFPHFSTLLDDESNKEVIEKLLECIRDLCDEMGPASIENHIEMIMNSMEKLLEKKAFCQVKTKDAMDDDEEEKEEEDSEPDEDDEEDLDHDEIILGNTTDLIISLSKCMGDSFLPYLQRLGPKLVKYLGDDHPKRDKIMVIGCLAETFNSSPSAITTYFDDFMQVLIKHSVTADGSMNRNVSYGLGILADKAPTQLFEPHLETAMNCVKNMYTASQEDDAKDNCIACLVRILEGYR